MNGLAGVQKASVLTENEAVATALINAEARFQATERCILFEDFVGTGKQARNVLLAVRNLLPQTRILFAPLIVLERGQSTLREIASDTLEVSPYHYSARFELHSADRDGFRWFISRRGSAAHIGHSRQSTHEIWRP